MIAEYQAPISFQNMQAPDDAIAPVGIAGPDSGEVTPGAQTLPGSHLKKQSRHFMT